MRKLISGLHEYQHHVFKAQKELFAKLSQGQSPEALFITCSDSRIDPNMLTQTEPGDLFVLRNAGNIVPPYGAGHGGEAATIEFAVDKLGVKDIIICGHSLCGAIKAVFNREVLADMPMLTAFLAHAESTRRIVLENYHDIDPEGLLNIGSQENVLVQVENLRTHPSVAARLAKGDLNIHAWMYKMETGAVFGYDAGDRQFLPATEFMNQSGKSSRNKLVGL
ncbi:MAG: carbonic anhydrase [Cyanobacteria bacterium SZAS-4]|nr:carbonic anhydrase [Cyanobacteria bacterium SZAS-4]